MPARGNSKKQGISIREAARRLGMSDVGLGKRIKQGKFKTLADGSIDPDYLDAQEALYNQQKDPMMGGKRVKGGSIFEPSEPPAGATITPPRNHANELTFEEVRKAAVLRDIRLKDLEYAEKAKTLVLLERVEKALTDLGALARSVLERIPDKLSQQLAAETDAHKIRVALITNLDEAMAEIATRSEQLAGEMTE